MMPRIFQIGSLAMNHVLGEEIRPPLDSDILASYEDAMAYGQFLQGQHGKMIKCFPVKDARKLFIQFLDRHVLEAELIWEDAFTGHEMAELILRDPATQKETMDGWEVFYPSLNFLLMLKMSHRYLRGSPHFLKTMSDIHLMRSRGATMEDLHADFYRRRQAATYWYRHPNLSVEKKDFFKLNQGVSYRYDHDDIHECVKHMDIPAYKLFLKDGQEIACDEKKFSRLPDEIKIYSVLEECYTLSLERSLIPFDWKPDPKEAFLKSLKGICTHVASGWWREYAWENYHTVVDAYRDDYMNVFLNRLKTNDIRPFKIEGNS